MKINENIEGDQFPSLENLFQDLEHPNPNINKQASLDMVKFWPKEALSHLLANLDSKDVALRRKSVKALSEFGFDIVLDLCEKYLSSKEITIRISCLKVLVKIAAKNSQCVFPDEVMNLIELALLDESPEMILVLITLLRQLGRQGVPILLRMAKDVNVLRASASITALGEMNNPSVEVCLKEILESGSIDEIVHNSAADALKNYRSLRSFE